MATATDISECIQSNDFLTLKNIGMLQGFGNNNNQRILCYAILLGCGRIDVYDSNVSDKHICIDLDEHKNEYSKLIARDIERNGYCRWNKTSKYSDYQKRYDLSQIKTLLNVVFSQHYGLHYIQSMDSVFAVFYLISNGNLIIAKKIIVSYLNVFKSDLSLICINFGQLPLIWKMINKYD
eukprot:445539_1